MKMVRWSLAAVLALAALAYEAPVSPLAAQDAEVRECRCVDRDGNEIERCSCFRAPNVRVFAGPGNLTGFFGDARPRLGISIDPLQSARHDARGVRVTDVVDGGPADEAGLRVGDIITSVDGHSLFDPLGADAEEDFDLDRSIPVQRLMAISRGFEEGQQVEIEYLRDDEARTATVEADEVQSWGNAGLVGRNWSPDELVGRLRELREAPRVWQFRNDRDHAGELERNFRIEAPRGEFRFFGDGDGPELLIGDMGGGFRSMGISRIAGVEMMDLRPGLAAHFGVEAGVLVSEVEDDSQLGLEAGDVIVRIGDREVSTASRAQQILRTYEQDEEVTLHIRRDGRDITVTGRLD